MSRIRTGRRTQNNFHKITYYVSSTNKYSSVGYENAHQSFPAEVENYIQSKVNSGFYGNASEVVRDAIRRLRDEDEKFEALRAAIKIGDDQIARGECERYSPTLMTELTRQAIENSKPGKKVNPDVAP